MKKVFILCLSFVFILTIQSCTKDVLVEPTPIVFNSDKLEFSVVKHLSYTGNYAYTGTTKVTSITIPANKVWKIESASAYSTTTTIIYGVFIDNQAIGNPNVSYPIWLPSGTYDIEIRSTGGNVSVPYNIAMSVIEYNIK